MMRPNVPTDGQLWNHLLETGAEIGDLMEIGSFRGATFAAMVDVAGDAERTAHAVDSWEGMAEPGPMDGDRYPAGKFDIGGLDWFHKEMHMRGFRPHEYEAHQGYVPEVLDTLPQDIKLGFCHIDLDQYGPTLQAAQWAWKRLVPGGVLAFHDWKPGQELYAAAAISHWLHETAKAEPVTVRTESAELFAMKCK